MSNFFIGRKIVVNVGGNEEVVFYVLGFIICG